MNEKPKEGEIRLTYKTMIPEKGNKICLSEEMFNPSLQEQVYKKGEWVNNE